MKNEYLISTVVENKPGVLYRTANVFRQRGYNIRSISVGELRDNTMSRMTFTIDADEMSINQLVGVMNKQIDVVEVKVLDPKRMIKKELALIKIYIKNQNMIPKIRDIANIGTIIDESVNSIVIEITGTSEKITDFIELASDYGKLDIARTGVTAIERGE
ncbi:MAG: acetolactate synthase small subunit [Thaumarchaeota archaeon]|nr:acetolactate synthase small subunit [Nitrososphaerota archaeon]|tara:strand:- start:329 stop:808 length:480 start_codon:yes stop_codon:yes gene_type:complete